MARGIEPTNVNDERPAWAVGCTTLNTPTNLNTPTKAAKYTRLGWLGWFGLLLPVLSQ